MDLFKRVWEWFLGGDEEKFRASLLMWYIALSEVDKAAAACRAAFAAHPEETWAWCVYRAIRLAPLIDTAEDRILCILRESPMDEVIHRLDNFRPVLSPIPESVRRAGSDYACAAALSLAEWDKCRAITSSNPVGYYFGPLWRASDEAVSKFSRIVAEANSNRELDSAHLADVPHHTWNGKDIF